MLIKNKQSELIVVVDDDPEDSDQHTMLAEIRLTTYDK